MMGWPPGGECHADTPPPVTVMMHNAHHRSHRIITRAHHRRSNLPRRPLTEVVSSPIDSIRLAAVAAWGVGTSSSRYPHTPVDDLCTCLVTSRLMRHYTAIIVMVTLALWRVKSSSSSVCVVGDDALSSKSCSFKSFKSFKSFNSCQSTDKWSLEGVRYSGASSGFCRTAKLRDAAKRSTTVVMQGDDDAYEGRRRGEAGSRQRVTEHELEPFRDVVEDVYANPLLRVAATVILAILREE
eukprot:1196133-Prorocentrum_minimum.AAC.5